MKCIREWNSDRDRRERAHWLFSYCSKREVHNITGGKQPRQLMCCLCRRPCRWAGVPACHAGRAAHLSKTALARQLHGASRAQPPPPLALLPALLPVSCHIAACIHSRSQRHLQRPPAARMGGGNKQWHAAQAHVQFKDIAPAKRTLHAANKNSPTTATPALRRTTQNACPQPHLTIRLRFLASRHVAACPAASALPGVQAAGSQMLMTHHSTCDSAS